MTRMNARVIDLELLIQHYCYKKSFEEIGVNYGVSRQRAHQRVKRAIKFVKGL